MNEGILSKDFPQPLLGHFTRGDDEGVQLIIFITRGGTPIWNRRGCSSEILNLTPKGDHLGVAQAFCDP